MNTLHSKPNIILLQDTKINKNKSTTYIDNKFSDYKIIYNNLNTTNLGRNRQYTTCEPPRGGVMTMIHKKIYTYENITKIPTPIKISHYLQVFKIANKPLTPILIMNLYILSHPHDIHLIPGILTQIDIITKHHHLYKTILAGDFNRDIFLQGHNHKGKPQAPTNEDKE